MQNRVHGGRFLYYLDVLGARVGIKVGIRDRIQGARAPMAAARGIMTVALNAVPTVMKSNCCGAQQGLPKGGPLAAAGRKGAGEEREWKGVRKKKRGYPAVSWLAVSRFSGIWARDVSLDLQPTGGRLGVIADLHHGWCGIVSWVADQIG